MLLVTPKGTAIRTGYSFGKMSLLRFYTEYYITSHIFGQSSFLYYTFFTLLQNGLPLSSIEHVFILTLLLSRSGSAGSIYYREDPAVKNSNIMQLLCYTQQYIHCWMWVVLCTYIQTGQGRDWINFIFLSSSKKRSSVMCLVEGRK